MTIQTQGTYTTLKVEKQEGIATVTIDRPQVLNALNATTLQELSDAFCALEQDSDIHVVILTGGGEKSFVSGADISELVPLDAVSAVPFAQRGQGVSNLIENLDRPVIAAINGYALGGGCELAMACDIRIASEKAKFGQPEVKLGIIPGYGGTQRLPRLVGKGKAMELILTGGMIDAREALRLGLVEKVVPPGTLMEAAREMAKAIIANGPLAVRAAKRAINRGLSMDLTSALCYEEAQFAASCASQDKNEGTAAFLEKRKAGFCCR